MAVRALETLPSLFSPVRGFDLNSVHSVPYKSKPASPSPKRELPPLFVASSLEDWLLPESDSYQGLLLPRKPFWKDYQLEIDRLQGYFGAEDQMQRRVVREEGSKSVDFRQLNWVLGRLGSFLHWDKR